MNALKPQRTLDATTLTAAKAGSGTAMRRIYEELAPAIFGYAKGRRVEDPEALVNETKHKAFEGLGHFDGDGGHYRSFVFTIAHNLIVDDHRRRGRRVQTVALDRAHAQAGSTDIAELAVQKAQTDTMLDWIDGLSQDQRSVVLLRVVLDLPISEVARILGKRKGAIKALQHRGIAALRRRFEAEGVSHRTLSTFTPVP